MKVYTASFSSFSPIVFYSFHAKYSYRTQIVCYGKRSADAALLYGAYGNATPFYYGGCPYTYNAGYSSPSTPMLMVPDMVHTPTWDKLFYFFCVS